MKNLYTVHVETLLVQRDMITSHIITQQLSNQIVIFKALLLNVLECFLFAISDSERERERKQSPWAK